MIDHTGHRGANIYTALKGLGIKRPHLKKRKRVDGVNSQVQVNNTKAIH